jgi:hypothetical protein
VNVGTSTKLHRDGASANLEELCSATQDNNSIMKNFCIVGKAFDADGLKL